MPQLTQEQFTDHLRYHWSPPEELAVLIARCNAFFCRRDERCLCFFASFPGAAALRGAGAGAVLGALVPASFPAARPSAVAALTRILGAGGVGVLAAVDGCSGFMRSCSAIRRPSRARLVPLAINMLTP